MTNKENKRSPFEENLVKVLSSIDTQIAREMQRSPSEREEHGVQKWEPYQKRIELIVSTVLNGLGDEELSLDSVIVFSQAMVKTLLLSIEDLEVDGLGKVRAGYCYAAMENIQSDAYRALQVLKPDEELN